MEIFLNPERQKGFDNLTLVSRPTLVLCLIEKVEGISSQLHCKRSRPLGPASTLVIQVCRTANTHPIHTRMVVKPLILLGQHRVHENRRNFLQRNIVSVLNKNTAQLAPFTVQNKTRLLHHGNQREVVFLSDITIGL